MSVKSRIVAIMAAIGAVGAVAAAPAVADGQLQIESFTTTNSTTQLGRVATEAGGHPDFATSFRIRDAGVEQSPRNVVFNAPEGLFGDPNVVEQCTPTDFALQACPFTSQVGLITIYANYQGNPEALMGTAPIFDMVPGDNTALFAFIVPKLGIPISIPVSVRTASDYGLRFTVSEITQNAPLAGVDLEFWGFPADSAHDADRFPTGSPGNPAGCPNITEPSCIGAPLEANIPPRPFTQNPTVCTGHPLTASLEVDTYQNPGQPSKAYASYPAITGCEREAFRPVLYMNPTTNETDSPSGLNLDLIDPQPLNVSNAPSEIRSAVVTLPPGLTVNPDAADGQRSCTDAQANFDGEGPDSCPDNAKIGTFGLHTDSLEGTLEGSIYIGEPKPENQYRLFLIANGFGLHVKLEGIVHPDPSTGQITVRVEHLPQVSFDRVEIHLFASDRGLMATPTDCRLYPVSAQFFPWNTSLADQTSTQFFSLDSGPHGSECPGQVRPFHPRLAAGTSNATAGAFSDFHLKLDRDDGDQFLRDVNFTMPPGFTGDLRGIAYCPEAAIAAAAQRPGAAELASPSCPSTSQVGTSNVAAGPGTHPFHAVGRMYLAGPLNGAPLSLAVITPALAGPYDYGTIVVRVALHVDPLTAQVSALSDPMPQIVGGIPIRMRSIRVNIDRPHFTINPTNCSPFSVDSQGVGDQGTSVNFSSYFNAVNCVTLPFGPKMQIRQLGGRKKTRRSQDPSLRFDLWTHHGDANIRSVAVTLPKAWAVDQRHLGNLCSRAELASKHCAGRQSIGRVEVHTPLLDQPLKGLAYAVSGYGKLPHIAFILGGQVTLIPEAESSSVHHGNLKTVVPVVPDAPIGHFRLTLYGGKKGYLTNTRNLCAGAALTNVEFGAQNGKKRVQRVKPKMACGKRKRHKGHRHKANRIRRAHRRA
jgi:hypothetical protein